MIIAWVLPSAAVLGVLLVVWWIIEARRKDPDYPPYAVYGIAQGYNPYGGALNQIEYVKILEADTASVSSRFQVPGTVCRFHNRPVKDVFRVVHPVWDGPFDGTGSGLVDERVFPFCSRCDGRRRETTYEGIPIRLPWNGTFTEAGREWPIRINVDRRLLGRPVFDHLYQMGLIKWIDPKPAESPT